MAIRPQKSAKIRIATEPKSGNALHHKTSFQEELTVFCNALHYRIDCFQNGICDELYPDDSLLKVTATVSVKTFLWLMFLRVTVSASKI